MSAARPFPIEKYANVPVHPARPAALKMHDRAQEQKTTRKVDQAARVLASYEKRSENFAELIKALQARKAQVDKKAAQFEEAVIAHMQAAGFDQIHGRTAQFELRPAPLAVAVLDAKKIPDQYIRTTINTAPDKVAIKTALIKGEDVPGCGLSQKVSLIRK